MRGPITRCISPSRRCDHAREVEPSPRKDRSTAPPLTGNVNISIPSCPPGAVAPNCISPDFQATGAGHVKVDQYDFNNREFAILSLPNNYDPMTPYPVILEGGGGTNGPTDNGGGFDAGEGRTPIRVGLSYVARGACFADGGVWLSQGTGFGCSPDEAHVGMCVNTPEVPYAPMRDALLTRNGCSGTATTMRQLHGMSGPVSRRVVRAGWCRPRRRRCHRRRRRLLADPMEGSVRSAHSVDRFGHRGEALWRPDLVVFGVRAPCEIRRRKSDLLRVVIDALSVGGRDAR